MVLLEAKRLPKLPGRMQEVVDYLRRDPKRTYISYEAAVINRTPVTGEHRPSYRAYSISAYGGGKPPAGNTGIGGMNIKFPTFLGLKKRGVIVPQYPEPREEWQEGKWILAPKWRV